MATVWLLLSLWALGPSSNGSSACIESALAPRPLAGWIEAFPRECADMQRTLRTLLRKRGVSDPDADDILQTSFAKVFAKADLIHEPLAYMTTVVLREYYSEKRRQKLRVSSSEMPQPGRPLADQINDRVDLWRALEQLSEGDLQLVIAAHVLQMDLGTLAARQKKPTSANAVAVRIHRARQQVRERLAGGPTARSRATRSRA